MQSMALDQSGNRLLASEGDGIRLWKIEGLKIESRSAKTGDEFVLRTALTQNGTLIAAAGMGNSMYFKRTQS